MHQDDRKRMFAAAKLTVRAYAKDPSDNNAARVHAAWKAVSDMKTRSFWRQWQEARHSSPTATKPTDQGAVSPSTQALSYRHGRGSSEDHPQGA